MDHTLAVIFADGAVIQVAALLGASLFFLTVGLLEVRNEHPEGFLYLTIALFFILGHIACLANLPVHLAAIDNSIDFGFWTWLSLLLAPALIALYLLRSLLDFVFSRGRKALVKLFFGLTLLCFLYMLGPEWPMDIKGVLTLVWLSMFLKLELGVVPE